MRGLIAAVLLAACGSTDPSYIVEGTVVEVTTPTELMVDHEAIDGFMPAMMMPFRLSDAELSKDLEPGDRIVGRLVIRKGQGGPVLEKIRVTGKGPPPKMADTGVGPLKPGQLLPKLAVPVTGGETWTIGEGQAKPTAVAFLYTTCPMPEYCPMVVNRLQGLQAEVGDAAQLVSVTIDPDTDTMPVLDAFAETVGAKPGIWRFGRLSKEELSTLTTRASLQQMQKDGQIEHSVRLLVLDAEGRLIERYDDNRWPLERVVQQLKTGGPPAPPNTSGTRTPRPPE
jgi:protein SCO1/2